MKNIVFKQTAGTSINDNDIEIVERKGIGHPDTICDAIAEEISVRYSKYCLEHFGCVLRHMIDKISVTGGRTRVRFGGGDMVTPAKIHLKGRFTESVGDETIPYQAIAEEVIYEYFKNVYAGFSKEHIVIENNVHFSPGPGIVFASDNTSKNERKAFFTDQTQETLQYHNNGLRANDTSTAVCYYPKSNLETIVLETERFLNSKKTKEEYPFIGTDIKVMGKREKKDVALTICVPLMSTHVESAEDYENKLGVVQQLVQEHLQEYKHDYALHIGLNTRDVAKNDDLYMTLLGSSLESGDEGAVGRGNRVHGVIPFTRNFSMEAPCGKNPVYHVGKVYTALAYVIAKMVYEKYSLENTVYTTSQIGKSLSEPWLIYIETNGALPDESALRSEIEDTINHPEKITDMILNREIPFC